VASFTECYSARSICVRKRPFFFFPIFHRALHTLNSQGNRLGVWWSKASPMRSEDAHSTQFRFLLLTALGHHSCSVGFGAVLCSPDLVTSIIPWIWVRRLLSEPIPLASHRVRFHGLPTIGRQLPPFFLASAESAATPTVPQRKLPFSPFPFIPSIPIC